MVHLTNRFLHLFLLLIAIGVLDFSSPNSITVEAIPLQQRSFNKLARVGIVVSSNGNGRRSSTDSAFDDYVFGATDKGTHTLPLTRIDQRSQIGHPLMLLQHHINRATVKLAKIKGRSIPTMEDLQNNFERRKRSILDMEAVKRSQSHLSYLTSSSNRFTSNRGRIGVVLKGSKNINTASKENLEERSPLELANSPIAATRISTIASVKKTSSTKKKSKKTKTTDTTLNLSTAANAKGYPEVMLEAANSEVLKAAKAVTVYNTLGLAIEANDVGYITTVQIGSNNTNFRMLIDSGSADTWVPSTSCTGCGSSHQKLGKTVSSTYSKTSTAFSIQYGTGQVSGYLGYDTLKIAGMTLKNHSMAIITKESSDFSDDSVPFDGLMGLAQKSLSNSGKPTPIDSLYSSKLVSAVVMGYHLGRAADKVNDGEVTFGGVDSTKYTGSLVEIPNVSTEGFFEIALQGVSFGGTSITGIGSGNTAILDTGTTLMVAPPADAKLIHAAIPGSVSTGGGGYTIPCNTTLQLSFTFGGKTWPLNSEDMIFLPVNDNDLDGDCISSISGGNVGSANEWLLGASFLKNVYFATNAKANVVGLGTLSS